MDWRAFFEGAGAATAFYAIGFIAYLMWLNARQGGGQ